jgi:ferredoxin-2, mitochondrial
MAIAARALRRLPLHLSPSLARSFCTVSPASASAVPSPGPRSAKVADRIVRLLAVDPDGERREIVGLSGQTLLRALANVGLIEPASHRLEDIDACTAECEVHIAQEWFEKLPPSSYEEQYVLTRASRNRELNKHARLGCQVVLSPEMQGMVVAVPEPKPWDIP